MDTPAVAAYAPETFGSQNKYALSLVFVRVITWILCTSISIGH